ncbi:hypothetical protein DICPUDRAFT_153960 [Dictyostelium purpureum]|uniref:Uncharacterized protein n=1 Tax=Dictyostelium purpureum TaxID=5786 RepID=F0ZQ70_DICPU|nr:uncharacterized protein DICPUDRAFT_153960 [Dictyostelium purpureum]EGC33931.1 hypothetical protein DICPUDRAFT_153960 [Dictyostelium purpureum]|eukprot:XP_003289566.1 hypothetical protein DICPUDRAFT_153960 [Dictyostelium purpureum]
MIEELKDLDIIKCIKEDKKIPIKTFGLEKNVFFFSDLPVSYPFQEDQVKCKTVALPNLPNRVWVHGMDHYLAIMKRDRTGTYYRCLLNLINNDINLLTRIKLKEKAHEKLFSFADRYFKIKNDNERKSYIKYNKNKEIEVFSYTIRGVTSYRTISTNYLLLSNTKSIYKSQSIRGDADNVDSIVNRINKRVLGTSDIKELDKVRPSLDEDRWGVFDGAFGVKQIPLFKNICFETLKHEFLINKEGALEKIKLLTFDLLQQFIENCCDDQRPIGSEIVNSLYHDKGEREKGEKVFNSLYPLDKMVSAWLNKDTWHRYNYEYNLSPEPYTKSTLINVYDNIDKFIFKKIQGNAESRILIKSEAKLTSGTASNFENGKPSIVDKETFIKNFHSATRGLFEKGFSQNVIFIGGIVTHCLTGQQEGFENSDIDICFLNIEENGEGEVTKFIIDYFGEDYAKEYSLNVMGGHAVLSKHYPNRPVQINLHEFRDIQDILLGVDIDCSCFAFNGKDVFTLERGMASLNHRINIASEFSYFVRGDNQYQRRLLKYSERGFDIFYHSTPEIEDLIEKFDKNNTSIYQSGFELLFSAKHNPDIFKSLLETNRQRALPYGPGWNKKNFDKYMKDCFDIVFDGYSSSGVYGPCEDLATLFQFRESLREELNESLYWDFPRFPEEYGYAKEEEEDREELYEDLPNLEEYLNLDENSDIRKASKSLRIEGEGEDDGEEE